MSASKVTSMSPHSGGRAPRPTTPYTGRKLQHSSYDTAVICASHIELAAMESMLDELHAPLTLSSTVAQHYSLGSIGHRNVVIAWLPAGKPGTQSAAEVATAMNITFPNISYRFMVGIGGGVPGPETDVREGDVVVSLPDGKFNGVVHYQRGKIQADGKLHHVGSLNGPPKELLLAVTRLRASCDNRELSIAYNLKESVQRNPKRQECCRYPGRVNDKLFRHDYQHLEQSSNDNCAHCDVRMLVERPRRSSINPVVHYGLVASADQVMRNGQTRENLRHRYGMLCFEMESSGLMDIWPCLVVRGISDYADTHKSDLWQPYAASVAAAYTKALINVISDQSIAPHRYPKDTDAAPWEGTPESLRRTQSAPSTTKTSPSKSQLSQSPLSRENNPLGAQYVFGSKSKSQCTQWSRSVSTASSHASGGSVLAPRTGAEDPLCARASLPSSNTPSHASKPLLRLETNPALSTCGTASDASASSSSSSEGESPNMDWSRRSTNSGPIQKPVRSSPATSYHQQHHPGRGPRSDPLQNHSSNKSPNLRGTVSSDRARSRPRSASHPTRAPSTHNTTEVKNQCTSTRPTPYLDNIRLKHSTYQANRPSAYSLRNSSSDEGPSRARRLSHATSFSSAPVALSPSPPEIDSRRWHHGRLLRLHGSPGLYNSKARNESGDDARWQPLENCIQLPNAEGTSHKSPDPLPLLYDRHDGAGSHEDRGPRGNAELFSPIVPGDMPSSPVQSLTGRPEQPTGSHDAEAQWSLHGVEHVRQNDISPGPGLRILIFDGGASGAIAQLLILKKLMLRVGNHKPRDYFHFIAGTGAGGLSAIMLGCLGMDIDACIQATQAIQRTERIPGERHAGRPWAAIPAKLAKVFRGFRLKRKIKHIIEDTGLHADDRFVVYPKRKSCRTVIVAFRKKRGQTRTSLISNYHQQNGLKAFRIWEVASASLASAHGFSPISIKCDDENFRFGRPLDGRCNPVFEVLGEVQRWLHNEHAESTSMPHVILSLGPGCMPAPEQRRTNLDFAASDTAYRNNLTALEFNERLMRTGRPWTQHRFDPNIHIPSSGHSRAARSDVESLCDDYFRSANFKVKAADWAKRAGLHRLKRSL